MEENKQLLLQFASISGKKVTADFTGGDVTSDSGVMAMREIAQKTGIIEQLARAIHDERHQSKEYKIALKSGRTSCHSFMANCFRVMLHSAAYVLMHTFREKALAGTSLANAQFDTIRLKLLKIGAEVRELKTKLHFILPASCPVKDIFAMMIRNIALVT